MHFKGTILAFEATSIALWLPQLISDNPKKYQATGYLKILYIFEDDSKEFETTSIDWRLAQLSRKLFEAFYQNL